MKESRKAHKSSEKKHRKKHKHGSEKKSKKSRRRESDSDNSSSDAGEDTQSQLQRERAAVQQTRHLLAAFPAVRKDLRQLLWALDNGKAVGLEGIQDADLREQLAQLLAKLNLKQTKGQYWLPQGRSTTLSVLGFVFDEAILPLAARPSAALAATAAPPPAAAPAAAASPPASPPVSTSPGHAQEAVKQEQRQQHEAGTAGLSGAEQAGPAPRPLGPQLPQGAAAGASEKNEDSGEQHERMEGMDTAEASGSPSSIQPASPARRRVVGPAMPAPELLAAAAAFAAATEAAGGYGPAPDELSAGGDDEVMVGPPPPEYVEADESAPQDERTAEVTRVLRVLSDAQRAAATQPGPPSSKAAGDVQEADAYAVLGVEPSTAAGDIRKRYWKLSLLVHPDKCSAPGAQEAFQAVAKAAGTLQDASARQKLDAKREDAELWRMAQEAAAQAERERQWRIARGEEAASTVSAASSHLPLSRETWMTDLPPERLGPAKPSQVSVTSFSRFGAKKERGDTSGWTDTPEMREARAQGLLQEAGPKLLTGSRLTGDDSTKQPVAVAAAMAEYNTQHRQKSLLEKHAGKQAAAALKAKKGQKRSAEGPPAGTTAEWVGNHPWRPFDRDKDLNMAKQPKTAAAILKDAAGLSSRFSSGK